MLVNAVLFHIVPVAVTRVFSPGLFTAVVLFLPVASWAYWGAWRDGVLTVRTAADGPLRRYVFGIVGASVTLGDWDDDGIATPAVTYLTTGTVTRYEAWP